MAVKTKNELKVEVLSWLRYGYEDDPECGAMSAMEIAETFGAPVDDVLAVLKELDAEDKVYVSKEWNHDERNHEYTPIAKGFRW